MKLLWNNFGIPFRADSDGLARPSNMLWLQAKTRSDFPKEIYDGWNGHRGKE